MTPEERVCRIGEAVDAAPLAPSAAGPSLAAPRTCLVIGGLAMTLLYVPFTLAHGPTSFNIERELLGFDMHRWGLLLGVVPNVLIAYGLWRIRLVLASGRRTTRAATTAMCVALFVSAAFDLAFRALGPPFMLFVLAPATLVAALTIPAMSPRQWMAQAFLRTLGIALSAALCVGLIPLETSDSFGGYRVFGVLAYGVPGVVWALLGLIEIGQPGHRCLPGEDPCPTQA